MLPQHTHAAPARFNQGFPNLNSLLLHPETSKVVTKCVCVTEVAMCAATLLFSSVRLGIKWSIILAAMLENVCEFDAVRKITCWGRTAVEQLDDEWCSGATVHVLRVLVKAESIVQLKSGVCLTKPESSISSHRPVKYQCTLTGCVVTLFRTSVSLRSPVGPDTGMLLSQTAVTRCVDWSIREAL